MAAATDIMPTASELVGAYSAREVSPVEVTRAVLDRVDAYDGTLNAYCVVDEEHALEQARASEQRWGQGNPVGLLDGVPVAVKDMFLTAGWPTLRGSLCIEPDQAWHTDAPPVARLREHGAVLLGKTTTAEIGWKAVTDSPLTGITRNPWNPALTAGGSSGGSASAVAAGMCTLALGTDGGGSLRIPGSFCGIAAFKPTYGRVPMYPPSPFGTLSQAGPLAWSVDDIALVMDVLALPDPRDPTALPPPTGSYREVVRRDVRGLIAGYSLDLGRVDVDEEVAHIVGSAVEALDDGGLRIEHADPDVGDPVESFEVLWSAGAARWLSGLPEGSAQRIDPGLARVGEWGARLSADAYLAAVEKASALGIQMGRFHSSFDVLLTPTVPIAAFDAGNDAPPMSGYSRWPEWAPLSYPFNMTGQPAATVPAGQTRDGRPVGLQVIGPRHSDDLVLAVCRLFEILRPWHAERPTLG